MKPTSERVPDPPPTNGLVDLAILDDDLDFCNYLEDALKDDGLYSIRAFGHPDEFFAACEQRVPDIVLLDMKMGEFKGDKVLEQLLAAYPGLCVIIVTGYPSLEDMRATFKMKVFDYISETFLAGRSSGRRCITPSISTASAAPRRIASANTWAIRSRCCASSAIGRSRTWPAPPSSASPRSAPSSVAANLPSIESLLAICRAFEKRPSEVLAAIEF